MAVVGQLWCWWRWSEECSKVVAVERTMVMAAKVAVAAKVMAAVVIVIVGGL